MNTERLIDLLVGGISGLLVVVIIQGVHINTISKVLENHKQAINQLADNISTLEAQVNKDK